MTLRTSAPFANANAGGLDLYLNATNQPSGLDFFSALGPRLRVEHAAKQTVLTVHSSGGATSPTQDTISTVGWGLVPKNVLAATWTYVNPSNTIIETDTFFNTSYSWTTSTDCPLSANGKFVVQDIATHEFGHSLGLSHHSDSDAQATMYPSAPANETRKITPTAGDVLAVQDSLTP